MQAIIYKCNLTFPVKFLFFSGPKRKETKVESSGCVPHVLISTKSGNMCWHLLSGNMSAPQHSDMNGSRLLYISN